MLTPLRWNVPRELSPEEARVAAKLHRSGKSVAFARAIRTELFDEAFQAELAAAYRPRGVTPRPPALLAMVTLLQAYDQVGDAEAVVAAAVDQRWQLVLGCLGATDAPFSQGALVKFRERMIVHDLDRKLLDRTVALAKATGGFGWQHLRAALDSSPFRPSTPRSPRCGACWCKTWSRTRPPGSGGFGAASPRDRMPSLGDPDMRHGHKPRTRLFTGYKRHVIKLVDADLIVGAVARPANEPEHHALALLEPDVVQHGPAGGNTDGPRLPGESSRGGSSPRRARRFARRRGPARIAGGFRSRPSPSISRRPTSSVRPSSAPPFPSAPPRSTSPPACASRARCAARARRPRAGAAPSRSIRRKRCSTSCAPTNSAPRDARLRERTTVEHALARVDQIQGPKARCKGTRKNTLDLRRVAVIANLQRIA